MKLPTLYHKGKTGKIVEWNVWTEGAQVHVEWGEIGGKKQTTFTTCEAKNVGKKNEVNPVLQAESEAKSKWQHNLDRKYSETIKEAEETVFLPMLAHEFDKVKDSKKFPVVYPVDVQPKLDGLRAMACWQDDKVVLLSRSGLPWNIKHLEDAIATFLPKGWVLDGEIYKPGLNLQGIGALAKKFREGPEGTESLEFHAFDFFDPDEDKPWEKRSWDLSFLIADAPLPIYKVPCHPADNEKEVKDLCHEFVERGYEGAIVRKLDGLYTLGERSRDLLKLKNFQDDEFKIIGTYKGTGKHEGCLGFICALNKIVDPEVTDFRCYPRGTLKDKKAWGLREEDFLDGMLTVRFQFYTDDGRPFLPIGVAVREKKDMSKKKGKK